LLRATEFKSIESDRIDDRGSKTRLCRQAEHNSLDEIPRRILLLLLQPEATKMGSFGRKDVSQSRAGVCGKALSPRESLFFEVSFDDIPRDHLADDDDNGDVPQKENDHNNNEQASNIFAASSRILLIQSLTLTVQVRSPRTSL
jgi:hypothetical protein